MASDDLSQANLPQLDWTDPERALNTVFDHAVAHSRAAEGWYLRKRGPKRIWGRAFRVCAIVLAGIAALVPILAEIWTDDGNPVIAPGVASVALVLAATLVALDRFFGFSSGWTRFMVTTVTITRLRDDFAYEWQTARAPESTARAVELLGLAHQFVLAVDDAVAAETGSWSTEFQAILEAATGNLSRPRSQAD